MLRDSFDEAWCARAIDGYYWQRTFLRKIGMCGARAHISSPHWHNHKLEPPSRCPPDGGGLGGGGGAGAASPPRRRRPPPLVTSLPPGPGPPRAPVGCLRGGGGGGGGGPPARGIGEVLVPVGVERAGRGPGDSGGRGAPRSCDAARPASAAAAGWTRRSACAGPAGPEPGPG